MHFFILYTQFNSNKVYFKHTVADSKEKALQWFKSNVPHDLTISIQENKWI